MDGSFLMSASSLAEVSAARGGLEGGEGNPEPTSGIPLCPYNMSVTCTWDYGRRVNAPPAPVVE